MLLLNVTTEINIIVDKNGKEWFKGRDVCNNLGFQDVKDAMLTKVKQAYKCSLKTMVELAGETPANPHPYHDGKIVYISEHGVIDYYRPRL